MRLLSYVRPYSFRLAVGVVLVAFTALADGIVALLLRPAFDYVLKPSVTGSTLPLGTFPNGHTIFLNRFFPPPIHNVWTIFSLTGVFVSFAKGNPAIFVVTQIQNVC